MSAHLTTFGGRPGCSTPASSAPGRPADPMSNQTTSAMSKKKSREACTPLNLDHMIDCNISWARMYRRYAARDRKEALTPGMGESSKQLFAAQARKAKALASVHYETAWHLAKLRRKRIHLIGKPRRSATALRAAA